MNYTLHQLKIFLKVVEKESITKAADELYLTQPAVSIQLKQLQEQFEIPLIEIIGRRLFVTNFGKEIAKASERILSEVEEIKNITLAFKGHTVGQLKISAVSTGKYIIPYFLTDFVQVHPKVDLNIDVTNRSNVLASLERNEIDFALVSVLPEHIKINRVELMQNKLFLIRKRMEENETKFMQVKSLSNKSLIYREGGSATRRAMEKFIIGNKIPLNKSIELTSNEAVKQALLAGLGYSIMPLIGIKNELLNDDLEIIQIKGLPIVTHWNLIWLKEKKLSPLAEKYLNFIEHNKDQVIRNHFHWYEKY